MVRTVHTATYGGFEARQTLFAWQVITPAVTEQHFALSPLFLIEGATKAQKER